MTEKQKLLNLCFKKIEFSEKEIQRLEKSCTIINLSDFRIIDVKHDQEEDIYIIFFEGGRYPSEEFYKIMNKKLKEMGININFKNVIYILEW